MNTPFRAWCCVIVLRRSRDGVSGARVRAVGTHWGSLPGCSIPDSFRLRGSRPFDAPSVVQLGEAHLVGDPSGDAPRRAVVFARGRGEPGHEAWALRLLGETAAHRDRPDVATAEAHYGATMTLASDLGMRALAAHCHLGLGKLYRRTGKPQEAEEHLTSATTMYREMGMTFWMEKAGAEMRKIAT
jgi:hypothetical protein